MSTENLTKFAEAVSADPALQANLQAIHAEAAREVAEKLAALSAEAGAPFTAGDFLETGRRQIADLSEADLEKVAGGIWEPSKENIAMSILSFGLGCAMAAGISALDGNVDRCQFTRN